MSKKVIVVQRHIENVVGIRKETEVINSKKTGEMLFTNDPGMVVENVKHGEPVLVVSGQVFAEAGDRSGIRHGDQLARIVKTLNPNVVFLVYSTMPEYAPFVDGFIPKPYGTASSGCHPLLPKVILAYERGMTASDLKKKFPQLR